ncbi:hypothetical protein GQR58_030050 [Nymphon striatum]|nr:hypothetical protein GQR58_030050 [Nymphon striatum]
MNLSSSHDTKKGPCYRQSGHYFDPAQRNNGCHREFKLTELHRSGQLERLLGTGRGSPRALCASLQQKTTQSWCILHRPRHKRTLRIPLRAPTGQLYAIVWSAPKISPGKTKNNERMLAIEPKCYSASTRDKQNADHQTSPLSQTQALCWIFHDWMQAVVRTQTRAHPRIAPILMNLSEEFVIGCGKMACTSMGIAMHSIVCSTSCCESDVVSQIGCCQCIDNTLRARHLTWPKLTVVGRSLILVTDSGCRVFHGVNTPVVFENFTRSPLARTETRNRSRTGNC